MLDELGYDGYVGVELDLSRHIDNDQVLVGDAFEGLGQEVKILHQKLEAVDQTAIWPQMQLFHDILEGDQVFDIDVGLVLEVLGGGVQVDVEARAPSEREGESEQRKDLGCSSYLLFLRCWIKAEQKVVLPAPAGPMTIVPYGMVDVSRMVWYGMVWCCRFVGKLLYCDAKKVDLPTRSEAARDCRD